MRQASELDTSTPSGRSNVCRRSVVVAEATNVISRRRARPPEPLGQDPRHRMVGVLRRRDAGHRARIADQFGAFGGRHVKNHHWLIEKLREEDQAVNGFSLRAARVAQGMKLGRRVASIDQALAEP